MEGRTESTIIVYASPPLIDTNKLANAKTPPPPRHIYLKRPTFLRCDLLSFTMSFHAALQGNTTFRELT